MHSSSCSATHCLLQPLPFSLQGQEHFAGTNGKDLAKLLCIYIYEFFLLIVPCKPCSRPCTFPQLTLLRNRGMFIILLRIMRIMRILLYLGPCSLASFTATSWRKQPVFASFLSVLFHFANKFLHIYRRDCRPELRELCLEIHFREPSVAGPFSHRINFWTSWIRILPVALSKQKCWRHLSAKTQVELWKWLNFGRNIEKWEKLPQQILWGENKVAQNRLVVVREQTH